MQDPLDALRRAYGEPDAQPERLAPEAQAEVDAIAILKAALDAIPPQRPAADTLNAVFAAAQATDADATLAPLRAVYEDEAGAPESAERRAFAETKAALDALPPQRPAADTLAAVFAAAEAAPLAAVRAVYDEDGALDTPEATAFATLKSGLDALPGQSPAASTLDAVFAAATASSTPEHVERRAADRAPQRLVTRRRLAIAASAAFALMLALTSGLWLPTDNLAVPTNQDQVAQEIGPEDQEVEALEESVEIADDEASLIAEAQPMPSAAGRAVAKAVPAAPQPQRVASASRSDAARERRAAPAAPRAIAPGAEAAASFAAGNLADTAEGDLTLASDEALPLADGEQALRELYLRTLALQAAQAGLGWDGPPEALGAAPDSLPTATGWMQVRVER